MQLVYRSKTSQLCTVSETSQAYSLSTDDPCIKVIGPVQLLLLRFEIICIPFISIELFLLFEAQVQEKKLHTKT